jgi:hypothetical protein
VKVLHIKLKVAGLGYDSWQTSAALAFGVFCITALGAALTAAGNTTLKASRDIHLLAAIGTSTEATRSKSSSGAIGLSFNPGSPTPGIPIAATLAASRSRAWSNGWGTTYYDAQVVAGQTLDITSGRDLTLKSAKTSGMHRMGRQAHIRTYRCH